MAAATVTPLTPAYASVGTAGTTVMLQAVYTGGGLGANAAGEHFYAELLVDASEPDAADAGLMLKAGETLVGTPLTALGSTGTIYGRSSGPVQIRAF
jgi:hypothetical protein